LRGIFEGQGAEQDGVDNAEDCGIGADTEGESEDGDNGEARGFHEHADGEFQILQYRGHFRFLSFLCATSIRDVHS
jgi:hypothetical protein